MEKVNGKIANDNCKLEFSLANKMKTRNKMIAIFMEPCMSNTREWKEHIGMHLGEGGVY